MDICEIYHQNRDNSFKDFLFCNSESILRLKSYKIVKTCDTQILHGHTTKIEWFAIAGISIQSDTHQRCIYNNRYVSMLHIYRDGVWRIKSAPKQINHRIIIFFMFNELTKEHQSICFKSKEAVLFFTATSVHKNKQEYNSIKTLAPYSFVN